MVHESLHIICGNCGHNHEGNNFTFKYRPIEIGGGEIINPATVCIYCKNCATTHFLDDYMDEEEKK